MHSLTVKLTLAFLIIGLTGALLVALLVGRSTRTEFDRFLSTRDQEVLVDALGNYYAAHGSWEGVAGMLNSTRPLDFYSRGVALVDNTRVVVLGNREYQTGKTVPENDLREGTPVTATGQTVGYVFFGPQPQGASGQPQPSRPGGPGGPPPDAFFLQQVTQAAAISAGIAALIALIIGGLLARTLTRPLRELTAATKMMAAGKFDQRVAVRSGDEIGELARSFNQMSADLARASQLRKQMTADLAHDLRTPLSILRGYTEGLQDGRLRGTAPLFAVMHGEVEHLQRLVEELRVLSLADAGELALNRRAIDPKALLEQTGLAYVVQAEQQGIALRIEAAEDLPSIIVDTDRMTQVLNNLVSNALAYTAAGEIVLSASGANGHVYLKVRDTGSGIPPEEQPFIFDRLYRGDKSRHRTDDTTSGLGLAIAKAIVEAHGGSISVQSTPGQGTTFTISLPAPQVNGAGGSEKTSEKQHAALKTL